MQTEFFMRMKPPTATQQEKQVRISGNGKRQYYDTDQLKAARLKLTGHLAKHVPAAKYTKAVRLITKWCFPLAGKHYDGEYRATRPDTDNLQKMLKDCMTTLGYWTDDCLVASEIIEKFWAARPGIYICIEELGGMNCWHCAEYDPDGYWCEKHNIPKLPEEDCIEGSGDDGK